MKRYRYLAESIRAGEVDPKDWKPPLTAAQRLALALTTPCAPLHVKAPKLPWPPKSNTETS